MRGGITAEEAEALMLRDLAWALFAARDVGRVLSDRQAAALASLVFNIGAPAWADSTLRRLVMAGDMAGADFQGGMIVGEWLRKRAGEPSTWKGLGWVLVAAGLVPVAAVDVLVTVGLGVVGLVEMARQEKP